MFQRITQEELDVITSPAIQNARLTDISTDVITSPAIQNARLTDISTDVITSPARKSRITNIALNVIIPNTPPPNKRLTTLSVNVIYKNIGIALGPEIISIPENSGNTPPQPMIIGIDSLGVFTRIYIVADIFTGTNPTASVRLYRAPFINGGWTPLLTQDIDQLARENILIDTIPPYGREVFYAATTIDTAGFESKRSLPVRYAHVQVD